MQAYYRIQERYSEGIYRKEKRDREPKVLLIYVVRSRVCKRCIQRVFNQWTDLPERSCNNKIPIRTIWQNGKQCRVYDQAYHATKQETLLADSEQRSLALPKKQKAEKKKLV